MIKSNFISFVCLNKKPVIKINTLNYTESRNYASFNTYNGSLFFHNGNLEIKGEFNYNSMFNFDFVKDNKTDINFNIMNYNINSKKMFFFMDCYIQSYSYENSLINIPNVDVTFTASYIDIL